MAVGLVLLAAAFASDAQAFTAVCKPTDYFNVDLAERTIVPRDKSDSKAQRILDGLAAMNAPSGIVMSFDEALYEGTIIFEGLYRSQGKITMVDTQKTSGATTVFYALTPGASDHLTIAKSGNDRLLFWTSQFFPTMTIYQFGCDVS